MISFVSLAALLMMLGVCLGAFGAHALKDYFIQHTYYAKVFEKAVLYHFVHALSLLVLSVSPFREQLHLEMTLMTAGILLFSGSLYLLSVTQIKWLGAITPIGGVSFIVAWLLIAIKLIKA